MSTTTIPANHYTRKIKSIQAVVAKHFNIDVPTLLSRRRPEFIVWPRQVAMLLCNEALQIGRTEIGVCFGDRNQYTVCLAIKRVHERYDTEPEMRNHIDSLRAEIRRMFPTT